MDYTDGLQPSAAEVMPLLQQIAIKSSNLNLNDSKSRTELAEIARSLFLALETPIEAILRMGWAERSLMPVARTAMDLKVFEKLDENYAAPKTSHELARMTGSDPALLSRLLKHLAALSFIKETGPDTYSNTRLSKATLNPIYGSGIPFVEMAIAPAFSTLPKFLADTKYKNPSNSMNTAFQAGQRTSLHAFAWFTETPGVLNHFNNHMAGESMSSARWMDPGCVHVEKVLGNNAGDAEAEILLVDVGGGTGHDLKEFHAQYPELPGRLVLQEMPAVVASCKDLPDKIEVMEHDFFTEQPVKGAKAYYLHSVLHDWPDSQCLDILSSLKSALKRGYSKVLINEEVIPATNAHYITTGHDMIMMSLFASRERTEEAWKHLLQQAGLKVLKIWTYAMESLIEAELE